MKSIKINTEEFLQQPKGIKKSYLRILIFYLIAIIGFSIFLSLSIIYGPFLNGKSAPTEGFGKYLFENKNLTNAAGGMSIFAFCLMAAPFVCWFSLWMIGINQVSKSTYFHLALWIICAILMVLLLLSIIIFTRAAVYNFNINTVPNIPAPDAGTDSGETTVNAASVLIRCLM